MHHKKNSNLFTLGFAVAAILVVTGLLLNGTVSAQVPTAEQINTDQEVVPIVDEAISRQQGNASPASSGVDHSVFEILQQDFETPQDLTKACLSCHIDSAEDLMHTTHWTWEYVNESTGQTIGKKNELNNFCVATSSNEPRCTSCHVGYGWKDNDFDFSAQENVDCLVCHDTTGAYKKTPTAAGMPDPEVDLTLVAQKVGTPSRTNCLVCHAYGGGGDAVKHGDIDSSLKEPNHALDVHMDAAGLNFSCTECHVTEDHAVSGSRYEHDEKVKTCVDCHDADPHKDELTNQHAENLACQSCHIPEYARGGLATKMTWDWSTAGEFASDGSKIATEEYNTLKGNFTWEENVAPEYVWFNGTAEYMLVTDEIDPSSIVPVNKFLGDIDDPNAKIWPVKRFTGVQPYDSGNNVLAVPHLFGKDENAYWKSFDWDKAIAAGMESAGAEYSGEYDFVETEFYWPITHMVAPAEEVLQCRECHDPQNERIDFAALGYDEERADELTWELDEYPETSPESLNELVSRPAQTNDWIYWLIGIVGLFGVFEVAGTRHINRRKDNYE
ncbi:MAG: tetrathionate reductase family octaheme c-type cytochrome [Anaerolineae bacterium]|jgi:octaheme c-type cytochrome (tetrathionate reductase family)|nr:tetrathionate reductase family octaheme c-type cytochrome [Anaerolineae bacterium]MBT7190442.1 tetrathionate reductase family octaheme c-type cytochrome [Anaerolineae bacterium]MBT7991195.1 tetrathionate reductase family octaheme c-type cytochrome [Anaerolineae bacterium]